MIEEEKMSKYGVAVPPIRHQIHVSYYTCPCQLARYVTAVVDFGSALNSSHGTEKIM